MITPHYHRAIAGNLSLRKNYTDKVIDQDCSRACYYGNISYRAVKKICEAGYETLPLPDAAAPAGLPDRVVSLDKYRAMAALGVMA
jgi:hypothetical protein